MLLCCSKIILPPKYFLVTLPIRQGRFVHSISTFLQGLLSALRRLTPRSAFLLRLTASPAGTLQ